MYVRESARTRTFARTRGCVFGLRARNAVLRAEPHAGTAIASSRSLAGRARAGVAPRVFEPAGASDSKAIAKALSSLDTAGVCQA